MVCYVIEPWIEHLLPLFYHTYIVCIQIFRLCFVLHCIYFRPLPAMESGYYEEKNVLLEAIKSLTDLIMQTAEATKVEH